jgi:asparagine synthase (glutamine-hydrolysing)
VQLFLPHNTVWKGTHRLLQSHWLSHDGERLVLRRYYDLPLGERVRYRSDGEYAEHYLAMLSDALRRTSRSHAPIGFAVSGGLDSSSLYCLAHRRSLTEVPLFKPPLEWYTAQALAERDIPIPTNGAMTMGLEQQVHADGVRVYIEGAGGDEWLQGSWDYYREFAIEGDLAGFVTAMRRDAAARGWGVVLPKALRTGFSAFAPAGLRSIRRAARRKALYADPDSYFWLKPDWRARLEQQEEAYDASLPADPLGRRANNLFASPFGSYARARMQRQRGLNGIDPRHPMFTRQFIGFSLATPEHIRSRAGVTKVVHRIAMRGILPDYILDRQTKADFESDSTDREMAQFCAGKGRHFLNALCDGNGLERLTAPDNANMVDEDRSWELWGIYAVAAFLMLHQRYPVSQKSRKGRIRHDQGKQQDRLFDPASG